MQCTSIKSVKNTRVKQAALKRDLYEHFLATNRETSAGGVVWNTTGYCRKIIEMVRKRVTL